MRIKRIVPRGEDAVFHLISRMAFNALKMGATEKQVFLTLLAKQAEFCGVEVLAYCILDNHFHLLVRVPYIPEISDNKIVRRYSALYHKPNRDNEHDPKLSPTQLASILKENGESGKRMRKQLLARMGNVSVFMKELKQRFGIWFNRHHQNEGTLWANRFESILVENTAKVLQWVGAYIELNPVRLKLCKAPEHYRYSAIGAASRGNAHARKWLCNLYSCTNWSKAITQYQRLLSDDAATIEKDMVQLKGLKRGVIGHEAFFDKHFQAHEQTIQGKSRLPKRVLSATLHGVLFVGLVFAMASEYPEIRV